MFNNLDEEINFFSPNYDITVEVKELPQNKKFVVIDNFYKNPDDILNLVSAIPPTNNPNIIGGLRGRRVDVNYNMAHLGTMFTDIISNVWNIDYNCEENFKHHSLCVNVQTDDNLGPCVPHQDGYLNGKFAVGIFLNKDVAGGTAFYTYKDIINPTEEFMSKEEITEKFYPFYIQDNYGHYKKVEIAEMVYNRCIIYEREILHTPYIPRGHFTDDNPRLMQMFFC